jgi:hypothetical protein
VSVSAAKFYVSVNDAGDRRYRFFDRGGAVRAMHAANSEPFDPFGGRAFENVLRVHGQRGPFFG